MARIGSNLPFEKYKARRHLMPKLKRRDEVPAYFSYDNIAATLEIGAIGRSLCRYADGDHPITMKKGSHAIRRIIKVGWLPRRALSPIAYNSTYARALVPFADVLADLAKVAPNTSPPADLCAKVDDLVALHHDAIDKLLDIENEDADRFRDARDAVVKTLGRLSRARGEASYAATCAAVAVEIDALLEVSDSLRVLVPDLRPSPRSRLAARAKTFLPPIGSNGEPNFGGLFAWLLENDECGDADLPIAIDTFCELVLRRCGVDPRKSAELQLTWELVDLAPRAGPDGPMDYVEPASPDLDEWAPWDDGEVVLEESSDFGHSVAQGLAAPDDEVPDAPNLSSLVLSEPERRLLRRLVRSLGIHKLRGLLLLQIAENWFFAEEWADSTESDFVNRLSAVRTWALRQGAHHVPTGSEITLNADGRPVAVGSVPNEPSSPDIRFILRDLAMWEARPYTELNADVPEAVKLKEQTWYSKTDEERSILDGNGARK